MKSRAAEDSKPHDGISCDGTFPARGGAAEDALSSSDQLLSQVYRELRAIAAIRLAGEPSGQTLQPTALVHEVYLRLTKGPGVARWNSRAHFFGAAAEAMRRILVERARRKRTVRAGGKTKRVGLRDVEQSPSPCPVDLLALNEALSRLEENHPRKAMLVKLRFFVGMTMTEAAATLGISLSTAEDDWVYARCLLQIEMCAD